MGFLDVLKAWQESHDYRGLVAEGREMRRKLKAALADTKLARTYHNRHQIYDNLEHDSQLGDDPHTEGSDSPAELRSKLLHSLCNGDSGIDVEGQFREFCHHHQRRGTELDLEPVSVLGRVKPRSDIEKSFIKIGRSGFTPLTFNPRLTVSDLLKKTLSEQQEGLRDLALSEHQTFAFYQPLKPGNPYHGVDVSKRQLRRRLGLGHCEARDELLYWGHTLPTGEAHEATAFDAETNPYWRPGGTTCPLDGGNDGLPEVVHEGERGYDLRIPIRRAR